MSRSRTWGWRASTPAQMSRSTAMVVSSGLPIAFCRYHWSRAGWLQLKAGWTRTGLAIGVGLRPEGLEVRLVQAAAGDRCPYRRPDRAGRDRLRIHAGRPPGCLHRQVGQPVQAVRGVGAELGHSLVAGLAQADGRVRGQVVAEQHRGGRDHRAPQVPAGQVGHLLRRAVEGRQERERHMVRAAEHAIAGRDAQPAVLLAQAQHGIRDDVVMDVDIHPASWRTGAGRRPCASLQCR